jgi:hypothetical protein
MMAQSIGNTEKIVRALPRTRLFLSATIRFDGISAPIRVRDLSARGARIEGARLPAVGIVAEVSRGELAVSGMIVWRDPKGCGMRFDAPIDLEQWMPGLAARDLIDVDDDMVAARRSGDADVLPFPSPPAPPAVALDAILPQRLAEELAFVGRLLDSLGEDLCGEPLLVMRHAEKLQNLDISAQILGHVAAVLVADRPEQAIDAISMTSLRKRLQRTAL